MMRMRAMVSAAIGVTVLLHPPGSAAGQAEMLVGMETADRNLISINPLPPTWEIIAFTGFDTSMTGLDYDPEKGTLYGSDILSNRVFTIDTVTGEKTPLGPPGALGDVEVNGLAFDPVSDVLYGIDRPNNLLLTIDVMTGVGTLAATIPPAFSNLEGLAFDPGTRTLYGLEDGSNRIVSIDPATGDTVVVVDGLPSGLWRGLTFSPAEDKLYATTVVQTTLYEIDPIAGSFSLLGPLSGAEAVHGLAVIPAPGSAVAVLGPAVLACRRRR